MKTLKSLNRLIPYLKNHRTGMLLGLLFIIGTVYFTTKVPLIMGEAVDVLKAVDVLENNFDRDALLDVLFSYVLLILLYAVIQGVFRFLMRNTMIGISRKIEYEIRNDFFQHLQTLEQSFYDTNRTGDLMSRATNDLNAVRMVLGPGIMYSFNTVILFGAALYYMIGINPILTALAMAPFPILAFMINRFGAKVHYWFEKIQAQFSTMSARAQENLSGMRIIKSYVREKSEVKQFRKLNDEYLRLNQNLIKVWSFFYPTIQFLSSLGFAFVLWYGGRSVINQTITLGDFLAFNMYLLMLLWPIISVGWVVNIFQRGSASMARMNEIFDTRPKINHEGTDPGVTVLSGEIEIRNLTFSYNENQPPVLKNISIKIPRGSTAAIIGSTGSGKSTLVNLIPRVYDPPPGTIFIDGIDIRTIPLKILRENIGIVPQETFLFSETIKENIVYGIDSYSDPQLYEAVTISQLRENIESFPKQFDTILGERGINLSGGQKQRAAISRAVIREPKILILDDALSSVDTKTEAEILAGLKNVMKKRTSIIISHRISTIKHADRIYVFDDGEIIEQGTHDELLANKGFYAGLYEKQLLTEELERA